MCWPEYSRSFWKNLGRGYDAIETPRPCYMNTSEFPIACYGVFFTDCMTVC